MDPSPGARSPELPARIGRPALRALSAAGVISLQDVSRLREADLLAMHGVGPRALALLRAALAEEGLSWRSDRDGEEGAVILRVVHPAADEALATGLLAVQHAAYAVEAALIGDDRIPALHEDLRALRAVPLHWFAAFEGEDLLGAVGWTRDASHVDVDRLVVAGHARRRGVGTLLVRAVVREARGRPTTVSTGRDNQPARALYERAGFVRVGEREVLPGLWVVDHRRPGSRGL